MINMSEIYYIEPVEMKRTRILQDEQRHDSVGQFKYYFVKLTNIINEPNAGMAK